MSENIEPEPEKKRSRGVQRVDKSAYVKKSGRFF